MANPYKDMTRLDLELSLGIAESNLGDAAKILGELQSSGVIARPADLQGDSALAMLRLEAALRNQF